MGAFAHIDQPTPPLSSQVQNLERDLAAARAAIVDRDDTIVQQKSRIQALERALAEGVVAIQDRVTTLQDKLANAAPHPDAHFIG